MGLVYLPTWMVNFMVTVDQWVFPKIMVPLFSRIHFGGFKSPEFWLETPKYTYIECLGVTVWDANDPIRSFCQWRKGFSNIWVFPRMGVPQNGWFISCKNPMNKWIHWGFFHYFWFNTHPKSFFFFAPCCLGTETPIPNLVHFRIYTPEIWHRSPRWPSFEGRKPRQNPFRMDALCLHNNFFMKQNIL